MGDLLQTLHYTDVWNVRQEAACSTVSVAERQDISSRLCRTDGKKRAVLASGTTFLSDEG
jgi:hypothetical protein